MQNSRLLIDKNGKVIIPKLLDWAMIYLFLFMLFINLSDLYSNGSWSSNNYSPYFKYYQNYGINIIYLIAVVLNCLLITQIYFHIKEIAINRTNLLINTILIISIVLIWLELWYGSTFYYGEVRDKQLPLGVNNLGILGSIVFASFLILRLPYKYKNTTKRSLVKVILVIINIALQFYIFHLLKEPWTLYIS